MRLQELRKSKKLTQQDVADFLNIERTSYARYENGTRIPPADTLARLADYYQTTVDYIMCRTEDRSRNIDVDSIADKLIEARQAAYDRYKILFDAANGASPEDIQVAADLLNALKARGSSND